MKKVDQMAVMQRVATWVFIVASVMFGVVGLLFVLTAPDHEQDSSEPNIVFMKLLMATVFVILPSFALSLAGRYLSSK